MNKTLVYWIKRCLALIVLLGCVLCVMLLLDTISYVSSNTIRQKKDLALMVNYFTNYIEVNKGRFPKSEDELQQKGFLVKKKGYFKDTYIYYVPTKEYIDKVRNNARKLTPYHLENYKKTVFFNNKYLIINYGCDFSNIIEKDGKLFDVKSNEQFLFISGGPESFLKKSLFEKASLDLYRIMTIYREN